MEKVNGREINLGREREANFRFRFKVLENLLDLACSSVNICGTYIHCSCFGANFRFGLYVVNDRWAGTFSVRLRSSKFPYQKDNRLLVLVGEPQIPQGASLFSAVRFFIGNCKIPFRDIKHSASFL